MRCWRDDSSSMATPLQHGRGEARTLPAQQLQYALTEALAAAAAAVSWVQERAAGSRQRQLFSA